MKAFRISLIAAAVSLAACGGGGNESVEAQGNKQAFAIGQRQKDLEGHLGEGQIGTRVGGAHDFAGRGSWTQDETPQQITRQRRVYSPLASSASGLPGSDQATRAAGAFRRVLRRTSRAPSHGPRPTAPAVSACLWSAC